MLISSRSGTFTPRILLAGGSVTGHDDHGGVGGGTCTPQEPATEVAAAAAYARMDKVHKEARAEPPQRAGGKPLC